jgi:thiamine-phosphate pyrophosphorylase
LSAGRRPGALEARRPSALNAQPIVCYVTDRKSLGAGGTTAGLSDRIRTAARAGVDWVQIREKDLPGGQLLAVAQEAVTAARGARETEVGDTQVYVNDRVDVAIVARAAGVHLGGESLPAAEVVRWCREGNAPPGFEVGVSCHGMEGAREAEQNGADYIFFGPVFDTPSKRAFGPPQGAQRLREVCRALRIPVIAIGGVNETNGEECIRAGASGIAAIRLFQEDVDLEKFKEFIYRLKAKR